MNLHESVEDFEDLIALTSKFIGIPERAVKRDYYIVMMLQNLELFTGSNEKLNSSFN